MKAKYPTKCSTCLGDVKVGDAIARQADGRWGHAGACAEYSRNKAKIESGETFRGTPKAYRRGEKRRDH